MFLALQNLHKYMVILLKYIYVLYICICIVEYIYITFCTPSFNYIFSTILYLQAMMKMSAFSFIFPVEVKCDYIYKYY